MEKKKAYCTFCGGHIGETSECTREIINHIYNCPKCWRDYCDSCSYDDIVDNKKVQRCLRCDAIMELVE